MSAPFHERDDYEVTACECGHLTLRIGAVRLDLSREEFARLRDVVTEAAARLDIAPRQPAGVRRSLMH